MQTITLTLKPSPSMPLEILDQVLLRAEAEKMTPEQWVFEQIQNGLREAQAEQAAIQE